MFFYYLHRLFWLLWVYDWLLTGSCYQRSWHFIWRFLHWCIFGKTFRRNFIYGIILSTSLIYINIANKTSSGPHEEYTHLNFVCVIDFVWKFWTINRSIFRRVRMIGCYSHPKNKNTILPKWGNRDYLIVIYFV